MLYKWDPELETKYLTIDNQHMQLVSTLNKLVKAAEEKHAKGEIAKVLKFMTEYTLMHFKTEEDLMIMYKYDDYSVHKKHHDDFVVTVVKLNERFEQEGPTPDLLAVLIKTIGEWLIEHIKGEDKKMAAFVRSKEPI